LYENDEKYKKGTKFTVCDHNELLKKGWYTTVWMGYQKCYKHINFPKSRIIYSELEKYQSQTLTVKAQVYTDWYRAEEENWNLWPVSTFLKNHECIEGMTPIGGWIICKICGIDLRQ